MKSITSSVKKSFVRFNNINAGMRLQDMRRNHDLTQKQLSDLFTDVGLPASENCISRWERGIHMPSWDHLFFLIWLYDCSLDELVMGNSDSDGSVSHNDYKNNTISLKGRMKNEKSFFMRLFFIGRSKQHRTMSAYFPLPHTSLTKTAHAAVCAFFCLL